MRQLRLRMSDETVRSVAVDENQPVANLMVLVCTKLGITNHDEYSLVATNVGKHTINGRRLKDTSQAKLDGRIFDAKMEQLKKKLKTDEDLAWLDHSKTLDEQSIHEDDIVLLRRKFFYSDLNVDSRDPIQLGLLYVQTRDAILSGTHPVTVDGACQFAGLQCQAQFGNFVDGTTTRPGYLSLKDCLPADYAKLRHVERKVFAEHKRHYGLSELEAKSLYVGEARSLPTYGVTFFLVKEKVAGKSKLVPRLLGVTRDCVMRVDADSKAILKTWPLTTVKRWAASVNSFTLDFGDYADAYYSVQTSEGEQISQLIAGYIDIILKRKKAKDHFGVEGDEGATMVEDSVAPSRATIIQNAPTLRRRPAKEPQRELELELASSAGPVVERAKLERGPVIEPSDFRPAVEIRGRAEVGFESKPLTRYVTNYELTVPQRDLQERLDGAQEAVESAQKILDERQPAGRSGGGGGDDATASQRRASLTSQFCDINAATAQLVSLSAIPEEELNYDELNKAVDTVAESLPAVARDVRAVAAALDDEQSGERLVEAARRLCQAFSDLLNAAEPGPTVPRQSLISAASRVGDATQALLYAIEAGGADELANDTLLSLAKSVANSAAALVLKAKDVAAGCQHDEAQNCVIGAATQCALATSQMVATAKIVAPTVRAPACARKLLVACGEVGRAVDGIQAACARALAAQPPLVASVDESAARVQCALDELVGHVESLNASGRGRSKFNQQQQQQQAPTSATAAATHNDDDDADADEQRQREANSELVKQARRLARATTKLIQDIGKPAPADAAASNRHSVYESSDGQAIYVEEASQCQSQSQEPQEPQQSYFEQQQQQILKQRQLEEQRQQPQPGHRSTKTTTTTSTTTVASQRRDDTTQRQHDGHEAAISGLIGDLESTILFATAGSLQASHSHSDESYNYHREQILRTAKALVEDTKRLVTSAAGDERELADAASQSVATVQRLVEAVKGGAASLGANNAEHQVGLIRSVKDVASSLSGLIDSTNRANGHEASDEAMLRVKDSAKSMVSSVTSLLKTVKSVEDEQERGISAIECAIEAIELELAQFDKACQLILSGVATAAAAVADDFNASDELIAASKPVTLTTAKTVAASSSGRQDDAIVAANMAKRALGDLLAACRLASASPAAVACNSRELQLRVQNAGRQTALTYKHLLELLHQTVQRPAAAAASPELKLELIQRSRQIAACVQEIVECGELLRRPQPQTQPQPQQHHQASLAATNSTGNNTDKGKQNDAGSQQQQAEAAAEFELLGAASSIDAAARKLENLKPRLTSVKLPHEELNFDEMILDAAKCIIEATAALLRAASASQRELANNTDNDDDDDDFGGNRAPHSQWSEGLVSAARMVAAATHSLVEAANSLVQGHASEERLISAAKQVASSTNQLLVACKVKAEPDSKSAGRLQAAGQAVKRATDNLVRAAQQAIEHDEEQSLIISSRKVSGIAQEISAREQILRKEKELQVAKTQLMAIRKAKYANRHDDDNYQGYGGSLS